MFISHFIFIFLYHFISPESLQWWDGCIYIIYNRQWYSVAFKYLSVALKKPRKWMHLSNSNLTFFWSNLLSFSKHMLLGIILLFSVLFCSCCLFLFVSEIWCTALVSRCSEHSISESLRRMEKIWGKKDLLVLDLIVFNWPIVEQIKSLL